MATEPASPLVTLSLAVVAIFCALMVGAVVALLLQRWLRGHDRRSTEPPPPFPEVVAQILRRDRAAVHEAAELYHQVTGRDPRDAFDEVTTWLRMNPSPQREARRASPPPAPAGPALPPVALPAVDPEFVSAAQRVAQWPSRFPAWPDERFPPEVEAMLAAAPDQLVPAIRAFSQATGVGIAEARFHVDDWVGRFPHGRQTPAPAPAPIVLPPPPPIRPPDSSGFPESAAAVLRANPLDKIAAIKEFRRHTGSSLLEAKNAVEAWMAANGIQ